jgi:glycosyltransferase involved in cell wall biosynthesis
MTNVSAIIIFHGEKTLAPPAIRSFLSGVLYARDKGISVETIAVVDKADELTTTLINDFSEHFDDICTVTFGDLGDSRNYGRSKSSGEFVTFFDGDDLWGNEWIYKAYEYTKSVDVKKSILHPEVIYYFTADDYKRQAHDNIPCDPSGFYFIQVDSRAIDFDPNAITLNNLWTANSFAHRSIYEEHPYKKVERKNGFGVEDWVWNAETLSLGYDHVVVSDTVHCVRMKSGGSLSAQNTAENLLPPLHNYAIGLASL